MKSSESVFVRAINSQPLAPFKQDNVPGGVDAMQIGGQVNTMGNEVFGRNNRTQLREIVEHSQITFRNNELHDPTYLYRSDDNDELPHNGWDRGMVVGALSAHGREETVLLGYIDHQTNVIVPTDELLIVGKEEIEAFFKS